jgi:hypothetical protein
MPSADRANANRIELLETELLRNEMSLPEAAALSTLPTKRWCYGDNKRRNDQYPGLPVKRKPEL